MRDTPILAISRLEEIFEDDRAGILELLEAAMRTGSTYQQALREGLERRELTDVMRAAHAIKGSSANVGGNEVAEVSARIEDTARAGTWDGIAQDADELDRAYDRLRGAVRSYATEVT